MPAASMPPRDAELPRMPTGRRPERQPVRTRAVAACGYVLGLGDMGGIRDSWSGTVRILRGATGIRQSQGGLRDRRGAKHVAFVPPPNWSNRDPNEDEGREMRCRLELSGRERKLEPDPHFPRAAAENSRATTFGRIGVGIEIRAYILPKRTRRRN